MRPNSHFPADLVTFTEKILNGKLHFWCNETSVKFSLVDDVIIVRSREV